VNPDPDRISKASRSQQFQIPPLPTGVTIERVYADLMRYLMEETQRFFGATTANGVEIWKRVRDTIVIVLATPNVWGMREQSTLRKAAIMAELVTEENAGHLLQFMTEAEASVHYALAQDQHDWLKEGTIFGVIDCGGSTVDTTIYRCESRSPLGLTETCPNESVQVEFPLLNFAAMNALIFS
jgi:ethanolamine utilization protein EutQ (cupin superfamily)